MKNIVLQMKHITKRYPGVIALDDVSIDFEKGQVHALLGENGAGKSTLIKVLSGAIENDEGQICIDGEEYNRMNPLLSRLHGIEVIYQEYNLVGSLSVAENICLGTKLHGFVNKQEMLDITQKLFEQYQIDINPKTYVRELSPAQQQLVEISKAISKEAKIIVMDEPTAQLTMAEVQKLYEIIHNLKNKGVTVIYISHRLEELFEITDCVTIMRDGCYVTTVQTKDTNRDALISLMVGRELKNTYPIRNCIKDEVVLEVKNISGFSNDNVSFCLYKGEILGLAGLVGAGRTELVRVLFGADMKLGGTVYIKDKKVIIKSPRDAIKVGIGLIPEDRKTQGCFLNMTIEWNTAISNIRKLTTNRLVSKKKIAENAEYFRTKLNIKTPSLKQKVGNLSGGNQQKVVLAKALASNTDIIIFDEPTRGIDIGARHEIYALMTQLVEDGKSIIMISSDMEELLGMSDRIIVLSKGRVTGELQKNEFRQETILSLASNE